MGKGYQPSGQPPSRRTRGPHLVWSFSFDLFSMDGPTRSQRLQLTQLYGSLKHANHSTTVRSWSLWSGIFLTNIMELDFCCEKKKKRLVPHKYVDSSSPTEKLFKSLPVQKYPLLRTEIVKLYTLTQDPVQRHIMTVYPVIHKAVSLGVSLPLLSLLFAFLSFFFPRHD